MLEQKPMEKITKLKIPKEKRMAKKNNSNNNNNQGRFETKNSSV